jgi:hypothetical protein
MGVEQCIILSLHATHISVSKSGSAFGSFVLKHRDFGQPVLPLELLHFSYESISLLVLSLWFEDHKSWGQKSLPLSL